MNSTPLGVGIVGAGERGTYVLGRRIEETTAENGLQIVGVFDRNTERAHESARYLESIASRSAGAIAVHGSLDSLLDDPQIGIVLITSYTAEHRRQSIAALERGKRVYLDKPISATLEDALAIRDAERRSGSPMIMGFTRRYEPAWRVARDRLHSGEIGAPQMILLRSFIPYARYLQRWHRFEELSGGAFNDKCSHHMDVLRWFTNSEVTSVTTIGGRSGVFAPDPSAPRYCRECDRDCPFRALPSRTRNGIGIVHRLDKDFQTVSETRWSQGSWVHPAAESDVIDACVFSPESTMWDHAVSTLTFASGVVATLVWNIYGPPTDDQETLEIVGASGRILLERGTGRVEVISGYGARREVIEPGRALESSHFGADLQLVRDIAAMARGEAPPAAVSDGVEALRMIEASRRSAAAGGAPIAMEEIAHG